MSRIKRLLHNVYRYFRPVVSEGHGNVITIKSKREGRFRLDVYGSNNTVMIEDGVYLQDINISINGSNNLVKISRKSRLYHLELMVNGDGNEFLMGENAGIREASVLVMEGRKVMIGADSMLSYRIHIRTSDSHKITDLDSGERINEAKDVIIGAHAWISQNVTLLKGADIGNHSVVGLGSVCSKPYPDNCIIAGVPGQVIKQNIDWDRTLD